MDLEKQAKKAGGMVHPLIGNHDEKKYPPGYFERQFEFGPNGKYGRWIRKHDSVIQINDTLFLH